MLTTLILAQAAAAALPPPDIELNASVRARDVRIERKGETRLEMHASPDAGSKVEVDKPEGRSSRLRNVRVDVRGEARIGDPAQNRAAQETQPPQ